MRMAGSVSPHQSSSILYDRQNENLLSHITPVNTSNDRDLLQSGRASVPRPPGGSIYRTGGNDQ